MKTVSRSLAGAACGLLAVAAYGAVDGYLHGAGANRQHPPGLDSAILNAFILAVFLGPIAAGCGALVGGASGLVGRAVEGFRGPRPPRPDD